VTLFDGVIGPGWSWSQRDEAMARRLLAGSPCGARTLAVAGNARTPASPTDLGVPPGAWLARQRPGHPGDPDPLRRAFPEYRVTPVCPPGQPALAGPAVPGRQRARSGPVRGHGGGCGPAAVVSTTGQGESP
jgi:hypothetical protein